MVMKTAELNPHAASVSPPHPMLGSSGDTIRDYRPAVVGLGSWGPQRTPRSWVWCSRNPACPGNPAGDGLASSGSAVVARQSLPIRVLSAIRGSMFLGIGTDL